MNCVVFRHKEDPRFLDLQRTAVRKLYGVELLTAGFPDADGKPDILLRYREHTIWPSAFLDAVEDLTDMLPGHTMIFEGDMIPNARMPEEPAVRDYFGVTWPSVLHTGGRKIGRIPRTSPHDMHQAFPDFARIPFRRLECGFEIIGDNAEFLHPQSGCRGRSNRSRVNKFFEWVYEVQGSPLKPC